MLFDFFGWMLWEKWICTQPGASAAHDYLRQDKSKEKRFAFDQAFGPDADTKTLFTATAEPLIKSALWWHCPVRVVEMR